MLICRGLLIPGWMVIAAQIVQVWGVHPTQVGAWKKQALAGLPDMFGNGREQVRQKADAEKDESLQIDRPTQSGVGFLKKSWCCRLRTQPRPESAENLRLMRHLDELYLKFPVTRFENNPIPSQSNRLPPNRPTCLAVFPLSLSIMKAKEGFTYVDIR
jgi:hypothetical protein